MWRISSSLHDPGWKSLQSLFGHVRILKGSGTSLSFVGTKLILRGLITYCRVISLLKVICQTHCASSDSRLILDNSVIGSESTSTTTVLQKP